MPSLASTPWTWSLQLGARLAPACAGTGSARAARGSPAGRSTPPQPAHPQQVGQVRGVPLVVLDPPVAERLHPQRVRQVHFRPGLLQHVRCPVPAVAWPRAPPSGASPALAISARSARRAVGDPRWSPACWPSSVIRTITLTAAGAGRSRRSAGRRMLPSSWASFAWWRRMLCTFQHPPGAEARSFIASPRPPSPGFEDPAGSSPPAKADRCAPQPSPHPPDWSWWHLQEASDTGSSRIPSRLAHRARPIRQY